MKKFVLFGILILLIAMLATVYEQKYAKTPIGQTTSKPNGTSPSQEKSQVSILATNLKVPWSIVFLPDGRLMFTEREGNVKILNKNGDLKTALQIKVFQANDTEGGLLGMALDPNFKQNNYVYLYYTYSASGSNTLNRVVRMTFQNDQLVTEQILVDKIPGALYHDGGRIKFGPDGYLYITTGDSESPSLAQDKNSLAGKILRVQTNGKPALGNPFGNDVYSYGHRNPEGITWDLQGNLWETEHGRSNPTGYDEVNKIVKGGNYGWPTIQGDEAKSGMITPLINSGANGTWAPSGAAYFNGSIFFGGLKGQALYEYKISSGKLVEHFKNEFGRIRDVVLGPDNMLYFTTSDQDGRGTLNPNDDKIIKVDPSKL